MKTNIGKIFFILVVSLFIANSNIYAYYELDGINYSVYSTWSSSEGKNVYHAAVEAGNYSGDVTIPDKVFLTFKDGGGERSDTLSVTAISQWAFKDCANLTSIAFDGPIYINRAAFSGCKGLKSLHFENLVGTICQFAFQHCTGLQSIYLGKEVELIDFDNPFAGDTLVETFQIYLGGGSPLLSSKNTARYADRSFVKSLKKAIIVEGSKIIGQESFLECINLDSIIIPNTVSELGSRAFKGCKSIKTIDLENNDINSIPSYCFSGCTNLELCRLPSRLQKINEGAFLNNLNLSSIIIPDSVSLIDKKAFEGCKRLKTFICSENLQNIGDNAFYGDTALIKVILPLSVTSIGSTAFSGCSNLTIFVPASAKIGSNAFKNCKKVIYYTDRVGDYWFNDTILTGYTGAETDLHFPTTHNGASYVIGASAFANLETKITSIHVPSSVTSIRANAFKGCRTLKSVILPANLTDIATTAFANCDSITSVTMGMHAETPSLKTLFASSKNKTLKEFTLQQGSTIMGTKKDGNNYLVFANDTVLESIKIPYSAKVVADSAFMNCKYLREVTIGYLSAEGDEPENMPKHARKGSGPDPEEALYVGSSTFAGDTKIKYITWQYVKEVASGAFKGCTGLEECIIPNTATDINKEAFANCTGLKVVKIPSSVTSIREYAFSGCSNIEDLTIECNPSALYIDRLQFSGCDHIRKLKYKSYKKESDIIMGLIGLLKSSLLSIEEIEFLPGSNMVYWSNGENNIIPNENMPKLSKVTIPEGVESLSFCSFKGCTSLKQIDLPNSLEYIGKRAFMNSGLETISLPYSVTSIDDAVLSECKNLRELIIGCMDMKTIPTSFCAGCSNLDSMIFLFDDHGHTLCQPKQIAAHAFANCTSLKQIIIPESVEKIDMNAFDNCSGVTQLVVEAKIPPACYIANPPFEKVPRPNKLWVPADTKESYSNAEVWNTFFISGYNLEATILNREQIIKAELERDKVVISWVEEEDAASYDLALNEVGTESSTQTFAIPSYTAGHNGQINNSLRKITTDLVNGIKFSIDGLKPYTSYNYSLLVRDTKRNVLKSYLGTFQTSNIETMVENSKLDNCSNQKLLRNGHLFILRNGEIYNATGARVE